MFRLKVWLRQTFLIYDLVILLDRLDIRYQPLNLIISNDRNNLSQFF